MSTLAFAFTKIVVSDLDASERFYRDAIGLKVVTRLTAPDGDYAQEESVLSVSGGTEANQLLLVRYLNRPAPAPGEAWTGFAVTDIDATVAAAEGMGAKVVIPIKHVPAHGLKAGIIADPEGHMIELIQMM